MSAFLSIFCTWQFILLCFGISAVCFVVRTLVEYFWLDNPNLIGNKNSRFWETFLLLFPVFLGFVFPLFAKGFVFPDQIKDVYSRFLFSASSGLAAPTIYRVIRAMLWVQAGQAAPILNVAPSPISNITNNVIMPPAPTPSPDLSVQSVQTVDDISQDSPEPKI